MGDASLLGGRCDTACLVEPDVTRTLISSRSDAVCLCCRYSSVCPSAGAASGRYRKILRFVRRRIKYQGSVMYEPYFPAASIRLHRQYVLRMDIHEDSFLKGAVPYFAQKPIALFRRFACLIWNSLILIAITLIVSVTAPRRVPRTGKMPLLIPLDSPLSWVSNRIDILQIR